MQQTELDGHQLPRPPGDDPAERGRALPNPLGALNELLSRAVTVKDIVAGPVWCLGPRQPVADAAAILAARDFDVAAVDEQPLRRYVTRSALDDRDRLVAGASKPILASDCVESSMPLGELFRLFVRRPFAFVLDGDTIRSVVTYADLQAPAVGVVVLAYLSALETGLRTLVLDEQGKAFIDRLPAARQKKAQQLFAEKSRGNVATSFADCLYLSDWLTLARASPSTVSARLGYASGSAWKTDTGSLGSLRNALAHGGTILDGVDPGRAIARVLRTLELTHKVWDEVDRLGGPWEVYADTVVREGRRRLTGSRATPKWPYRSAVHVITACNPGSIRRSDAANRLANKQLLDVLSRHDLEYRPVFGEAPDRSWSEPSFLVAGMNRSAAAQLGEEFGQRAVFELTEDELRVIRSSDGELMTTRTRR